MNNLILRKQRADLSNLSKLNVIELDYKKMTSTNGGALTGAAAVGAAVLGGATALVAGVAVGVAIYYGVKWLTN